MRRIWKIIFAVVGTVLALPVVLLSPPFGELSVNLTCRSQPPTPACLARMRAMGHVWMTFGWENRALHWYERAAAEGDDPATYFHLGWLYEQRGQKTVVARTLAYDEKLQAAAARDQARMRALFEARMNALGNAPNREDIKALEAEMEAARANGEAEAIPEVNLRDDFERAEAAYRKAAERGFAPAMNNLGQILLSGAVGPARRGEGVPWLIRAAEAGNPVGAINLSLVYIDGMTVPRDAEQAERWSHWSDKITSPRDLASPTLERTTMVLAGSIDGSLVAAIRARARTHEELTVTFKPMQPDARLPTFGEVQKELQEARKARKQ